MSSDDGWVIRNGAAGKFVLQYYSASADHFPPITDSSLHYDTLEEAVLAYNERDKGDYPSEYGLVLALSEKKADKVTLVVEQFTRKSFQVEGVQVTEENMSEVAAWCDGVIRTEPDASRYIKVRVDNPLSERQTKAFAGDWVLYAGKGYKVYNDKAFHRSFEQDPNRDPGAAGQDQNVFIDEGGETVSGGVATNPGGTHG